MTAKRQQKPSAKKNPKLRFPSFLGEWECKRLGNYLIKHNEKTTKNKQYPVLTSSQRGIFLQKDYFAGTDIASADTTGYNVVPKGFFTYRHMSDNLVFKFNINNIVEKGIVSTLYPVFKAKGIEDYFLLLKLNEGIEFKKYAVLQKQGGSRTYMYYSKLENLSINLPSLPEQQKITSFLILIGDWIENLKAQKESLEIYKKGVMQKIFSQKIRFKDKGNKDFPDWEDKKLEDVLFEHKTKNLKNSFDEVFSVAKQKGVINQIEHLGRSFASEDLCNYKVIYPGDVVYTKSPTANFPYGIIKQNLLNRAGVVSTLYAVFKPQNKYVGTLLHNYFLSWVNTYNYLKPLVQKGAKNTINIGNKDFLNGMKIPLPTSEKEQQMIVNFLISLDKAIELREQRVTYAKEWKKGLMQNLFV